MAQTKKQHTQEPRSDWHTMFYGALELILDSKMFSYQFQRELTKEPLQIDAIIVKKLRDVEPKEKIAKLFLRDNIVEFKSPDDYLSIEDFYKVHAYAYLYRVVVKDASVKDMTLTFVEKRHPRGLLEHLEKDLGYRVEKKWSGIYYVHGGHFPAQLIETKLLEDAENIWLRHLDKGLGVADMIALLNAEYDEEKHEARTRYIEPLAKANFETLQEASKMIAGVLDNFVKELIVESPSLKEWIAGHPDLMEWIAERPSFKERLAHESGFIPREVFEAERQKAEAERQKAERQKTIQKLNKKGWSDMEIAEFMELDLQTIQTYIATADNA